MTKHYSFKEFSSTPWSPSRNSSVFNKKIGAVSVAAATAIVAGVVLTVPVATAQAAPATNSTADAYTVSTLPNKNYGEADKIAVGLDQQDRKAGYLKFSDLGAIKSTDTITIDLRVTGGDAGTLQVSQLESTSWTETDITFGNAPATTKVLSTATVGKGKQDLTLSLSGISAPDGTVAIALTRSSGITRIASREASAADRPAISVGKDGSTTPPVVAPTTPPTTTAPVTPPVTTTPPKPPVTTTPPTAPSNPSASDCTVSAKLVPSCGAWFGAAANPLAGESWDTALTNFEKTAGRDMDIAHYYKRGQSAMFPSSVELKRQDEAGKNRILFYNWKPTGMTWRQVAEGQADGYLKQLAAHMKSNAKMPFFLSLNAEMEDEVNTNASSGQTATDFKNFFRHTVSVLRSNGVTNMVSVMNYTGLEKWAGMSWYNDLYPGNDVVDWIAQDPYAFGKGSVWLSDFEGMVNRTSNPKVWPGFYNWAATNYPDKPQMIGEWGVDQPSSAPGYKADFFKTAAADLASLPKLKALVYWDSNGIDTSGNALSVGRTQINNDAAVQSAFRSFVGSDILTAPRDAYLK